MFDAVFLMLLTGLAWAGVGVLFGAAPSEKDRLYSFFSLHGVLFTAFVLLARPPAAAPAGEVLRLAALMVPSGAMEVAAFLLLKIAMDRGSQGIAWSVAQSSMVVPFLCSIAFLGGRSSGAQWAGLVLSLAGLVLFGREKPSSGRGPAGAAWFRLVLGSFVLIGLGQFLRLVPGPASFSPEALTWRLPLMAPVGMVFWTAVCLAKGIWRPAGVWKSVLPYSAVVAIGQICFFAATDAAERLRLTAVVVPVAIGTCILLFALWCGLVRRERLSRAGWLAVALDVAGIALLSCP